MYQIYFYGCAVVYMHINHLFNETQNLRQHVLQLNANPIDSATSLIMKSAASRSKYNIFIKLQLVCIFRQPDLVLIFIFLIRFHDQFITRKLLRSISNFLANCGEENSNPREQFAANIALAEEFRVFSDKLKT